MFLWGNPNLDFWILKWISRFFTNINDPRSLGSWRIKGTNESLPRVDSLVPLMHQIHTKNRLHCAFKKLTESLEPLPFAQLQETAPNHSIHPAGAVHSWLSCQQGLGQELGEGGNSACFDHIHRRGLQDGPSSCLATQPHSNSLLWLKPLAVVEDK